MSRSDSARFHIWNLEVALRPVWHRVRCQAVRVMELFENTQRGRETLLATTRARGDQACLPAKLRYRPSITNQRCYHDRPMRDPVVREFLLAFWKVHILHHAGEQGIYGQWMLEELQHHGYRLSPGTLYPMLARMAARGWLRAAEPKRSKAARIYRLTARGREVLNRIREALDELSREVGGRRPIPRHPGTARPKQRGPATSIAHHV